MQPTSRIHRCGDGAQTTRRVELCGNSPRPSWLTRAHSPREQHRGATQLSAGREGRAGRSPETNRPTRDPPGRGSD
jgi:hypothetical protein